MDNWPELDALYEELRRENEEHWRRTDELRQKLAELQPQIDIISQQFGDLQVDQHLRSINDRLLAGLGSVEVIYGGVGIEYAAALVWPGHAQTQAEGDDSADEAMYRIDVWLGPALEDGRARIRLVGAKRLEAFLPTSSERFRTALLTVFRNPQRVERPETEDEVVAEPAVEPEIEPANMPQKGDSRPPETAEESTSSV
jgi:hypothetical protein